MACWFGPQQVSPATIRTTLLYMATQFFYLILQILFLAVSTCHNLWYLDRGWYVAVLSLRTRGYQSFITVLVA